MKKIVLPLFLIIAIIFISDKVIFITLNYFYKNTTMGEDGGELNNYLNNSKEIKMVLLGSSTTKLQVDPNDFHIKTINLGHHSTSPLYQSGILDIIIAKDKKPSIVLLSLSPTDFTIQPNVKVEQFQTEILFLKYYYPESKLIKENMDKIAVTERLKYILWSYRFNGNIIKNFRYYFLSRKKGNLPLANFSYQQSSKGDSLKVIRLMEEDAQKGETDVRRQNAAPVQHLINIIETCKKNNIQLLCYYMPMLLDRPHTLEAGTQVIDSLMTSYSIPYFKISKQNAPLLFQTSSYWVDLQHLNEKGGKIETALLSKFVKDSLRN